MNGRRTFRHDLRGDARVPSDLRRAARIACVVTLFLGCAETSSQGGADRPVTPVEAAAGDERAQLGAANAGGSPAHLHGESSAPPAPPGAPLVEAPVSPGVRPAPPAPPFVGPPDLVAGAEHTCALRAGRVRCWGSNAFHQLGDPALPNGWGAWRAERREIAELERVVALGAGTHHTCGVLDDGRLRCWGHGGYGQLGDGGPDDRPRPTDLTLRARVRSVSGGDGHTCAALSDGSVFCWGRNDHGQLGDGTLTERLEPTWVPGIEGAVEVAAGRLHTCARGEAGWVACWGANLFGQLGPRVRVPGAHRPTPATIARLDDAVALASGVDHTCALRRGGRVVCWGRNDHDQLRLDRARGIAASGTLALGNGHSCVLVPSERLLCVGANRRQQIGGAAARFGVARRVREAEGSTRVALGYQHTCWLSAGGVVTCRGEASLGRLGVEPTRAPSAASAPPSAL